MPSGWALKPSGLNDGDKFRLLFVTSTTRDTRATDIGTYNTFVQTAAKAGHAAISDSCGNLFKVVGSTATVNARNNAGLTGSGVLIHWLGGAKVADNYADFLDGGWDSLARRNENGATGHHSFATGSNDDGTARSGDELGASGNVAVATLVIGDGGLSGAVASSTDSLAFLAISPVFLVGTPSTPVIVSLARVGTGSVTEGDKVEFTVTLGRALVAGEIVDVPLKVSGTNVTTGDWTLAEKSGSGLNTGVTLSGETTATPQVRFSGAGAQTATLELTVETDGSTEGNETFTIALGPDGSGTNGFDRTSLGTNVGGGANPHATAKSFSVVVTDGITGSLIFSPASVTVVEGESTTYTVRLGTEPAGDVGVVISKSSSSLLSWSPLALRFTPSWHFSAYPIL